MGENQLRQHFMFMGNRHKTAQAMLGLGASALSWGGGFTFVDSRGDVSLYAQVHEMCRRADRLEDMFVLNFLNGNGNSDSSRHEHVRSNTINPFARMPSDSIVQLLMHCSALPSVCSPEENEFWRHRNIKMLHAVIKPLCWKRDKGMNLDSGLIRWKRDKGMSLDAGVIRHWLNLDKVMELAQDEDIPDHIRLPAREYLAGLHGFMPDRTAARQPQTAVDHHGYCQMCFSLLLSTMADVYGHIFCNGGDVDIHDIVLQRRILVVILPSLEKPGDEVAAMGQVIVSCIKSMLGSILGSNLTGNWNEVVNRSPNSYPTPCLVMFEGVGCYAVDGMALMAAQARSLGFSMSYSATDRAELCNRNPREGASIYANTNTRILMDEGVEHMDDHEEMENMTPFPKSSILHGIDRFLMTWKRCMVSNATVSWQGRVAHITMGFSETMSTRRRRQLARRSAVFRVTIGVPLVWPTKEHGEGIEGEIIPLAPLAEGAMS